MEALTFWMMSNYFWCHCIAKKKLITTSKNQCLVKNRQLANSETKAIILSKCIDWFETQEVAMQCKSYFSVKYGTLPLKKLKFRRNRRKLFCIVYMFVHLVQYFTFFYGKINNKYVNWIIYDNRNIPGLDGDG